MRLRRSCLSVPGSSERMLARARTIAADMVFVDLEDAVAPAAKTAATRAAAAALCEPAWAAATRGVRVNGVETRWCARDLVAIVDAAGAALHCVLVPKVRDASHVHFVDHLLSGLELDRGLEPGRIGLELMIESAAGLDAVERIASAAARSQTLVFGPLDYAADLGLAEADGEIAQHARMRIVNAARAHGLQAIDGPYTRLDDTTGLRASAQRSQALGMDGKWAIHPDQVGVLNEVYAPSREQFERAVALLASYRQAGDGEPRGAIVWEGEMIDEATRKLALRVEAAGRAAGLAAETEE